MKKIITLFLATAVLVVLQLVFGSQVLISISTAFFLISLAIGIWQSLESYRLKLASEKVETDVKLMALFTELMNTAHSRSGYVVSEKAIEKLFDKGIVGRDNTESLKELNQKLEDVAILNLPVGAAEQDAAIAAIAKLASRHEVLKDVAIEALESIKKFKPDIASRYLTDLTETNQNTKKTNFK